ncbi:hypothetical protein PENSPDRAFT_658534 [Peniophora sp. CONT]|nr:hypothetical protein PENSPDRAFT_658534 [Peniophora sp. CONT]
MAVYIYLDLHETDALRRILLSVDRIRTLVLKGGKQIMHACTQYWLNAPAPKLTILDLQTRIPDSLSALLGSAVVTPSTFQLPPAFAHNAPRLRSVRLSGYFTRFDPCSPMLSPSLEHLDIEGGHTPAELYEILQKGYNLRSLAVRGACLTSWEARNATHTGPRTPFNLLRLSSFTLETPFHIQTIDFLSGLELPMLSSVSIMLTYSDFKPDNTIVALPVLFSLVRQCHNGSRFQSLRLTSGVELRGGYLVTEGIHLWHSPGSEAETIFPNPHAANRPDAQVRFRPSPMMTRTPVPLLVSFYKRVFEDPQLAGVRTLTIDLHHGFMAHEWVDICRSLAYVEQLKLVDVDERLATAVHALSLTPLIFPTLSRLAMCSLASLVLWRELTDAAKARMKGQDRLRITFEGCKIPLPEHCKLEEFAEVTWDQSVPNNGSESQGNGESD